MKIEDILLENDTLKEVGSFTVPAGLKNWIKKKFTSDPITDKFKASAARNELDALDSRIASAAGEGDPTTSAVAKTKKAPTPMDAGEFAGTPVAKTKKAPTPMDAGEFAGTPVAKTKKDVSIDRGDPALWKADAPVAKTDREAFKDPSVLRDLEKTDQEAYADPSVMRDAVKIGQPERARGARGQDMTRADAVAQAAAKFKKPVDPKYPYTAPDGRRLKYPHGDLRNLFEPSPDTRKAGSDVVVRDSNKKKKPNSRMSDDDRK